MEKNDSDENKDTKEAKEKIPGAEKALAHNTERLRENTDKIDTVKELEKVEALGKAFLDAGDKLAKIEQGRDEFRYTASGVTSATLTATMALALIGTAVGGGEIQSAHAVLAGLAMGASALSAAVWAIGEGVNKLRQMKGNKEHRAAYKEYIDTSDEAKRNKGSTA